MNLEGDKHAKNNFEKKMGKWYFDEIPKFVGRDVGPYRVIPTCLHAQVRNAVGYLVLFGLATAITGGQL